MYFGITGARWNSMCPHAYLGLTYSYKPTSVVNVLLVFFAYVCIDILHKDLASLILQTVFQVK